MAPRSLRSSTIMIELNPRFHSNKAVQSAQYAVENQEFAATRIEALEMKLAIMHESFAVAVSSGTSAIELVLENLCLAKGGEVITSMFTFPATYNAIRTAGLKPVFADVNPLTGLIDVDSIEKCVTGNTVAVMPVHLYGALCDMPGIHKMVDSRFSIIEDACQAIGAYHNRYGYGVGEYSDAAVLSFYRSKNIGFNEGGAVLTSSEELYLDVQKNRNHAETVGSPGKNMRMSEVAAAYLTEIVDHAGHIADRRAQIVQMYAENGVYKFNEPIIGAGMASNHHLFTVLVDPDRRLECMLHLLERNVKTGMYYDNDYIRVNGGPYTKWLASRVLSLPCHGGMSGLDVAEISDIVKGYLV